MTNESTQELKGVSSKCIRFSAYIEIHRILVSTFIPIRRFYTTESFEFAKYYHSQTVYDYDCQ